MPHSAGTSETVTALAQKVAFLGSSAAYPHRPLRVEACETHMSWVFLTGSLVYKLKKPVRYPFLDFSTLSARHRYCEAELRLNRRLADDIYHRLVPLRRAPGGQLSLDGPGEIVEWLIEMEQLPAADMLDNRIREGRVSVEEIVSVGSRLGRFYAAAIPQVQDGPAYLRHLEQESEISRKLLLRPDLATRSPRTERILDRVDRLLRRAAPAIRSRIASGHIVEGHGDMRPEHVCLVQPPRIFDCLEFDRDMRLLDPYDEVNYLGLECEFLGAGWIRPLLLGVLDDILGGKPEPGLMFTYGAFRAVLRARISIAHLLDAQPIEPDRWPGEAHAYLSLAEEECIKAEG